jgi:hypothetical protein
MQFIRRALTAMTGALPPGVAPIGHYGQTQTQSQTRPSRRKRALFTILVALALPLAFAAPVAAAGAPPSPAPTNAQVVGVVGGIKLTWQDKSLNETSWIITDGVTNRYLNVANGATTGPMSFVWTGMQPGQYKCLHVSPYNSYGEGNGAPAAPQYWACTTASTAVPPSPDPSGLTAVGVQGGVQLTWQDNSLNETSWIITDSVTNRYLNVANGTTAGQVSYTWTGMGSHEWKCFHVRAYNSYGTSGYTPSSGYVCAYSAASTAPPAPTNVTWTTCQVPIFSGGPNTMGIQWEESGSWDSFRIYKSGTLIKTLTTADENQGISGLGVSGPLYFYNDVTGMNNNTLGVSAVKNGVASTIVYINNGQTFTC